MIQTEPLPWTEAVLDRGCERRSAAGFLEGLLSSEESRCMVLVDGKTLIQSERIVFVDARQLAPDALAVYLGRATAALAPVPGAAPVQVQLSSPDSTPPRLSPEDDILLVVLPAEAAAAVLAMAPAGTRLAGYREAALSLPAADAGIFIEASAIANWHRTHKHCPLCGALTRTEAAGWVRRCPQDNSEHYPRTDPAIIVAVVGPDERILLAGGSNWEANRYSTLAGFVEPGESLEQAVVREIGEEVGVRLHSPTYLGSQAWPFPASLMLGYLARTEDTEAVPDGVEITRARWFSRDELQQAVSSGEIVISTRTSIARALIENWYGGRILEAGEVNE
ncbi:NAD(+) diphosphatase [Paeniglutamicibacter antarcticus]|uniref:NAD(+) diphosphatase n=1 Tax=Arthrobacter terrae TaxID=2935737 RepID=A0A931CTG4_9MICC|nr:NAD(+) diphosphatase [Arthrobacter terrae]MBG0739493.1 NAD(+) diphosphatase [Arthrobacter terrae]